jgi:hypothetical protein
VAGGAANFNTLLTDAEDKPAARSEGTATRDLTKVRRVVMLGPVHKVWIESADSASAPALPAVSKGTGIVAY